MNGMGGQGNGMVNGMGNQNTMQQQQQAAAAALSRLLGMMQVIYCWSSGML
jgi:hypothetical protein